MYANASSKDAVTYGSVPAMDSGTAVTPHKEWRLRDCAQCLIEERQELIATYSSPVYSSTFDTSTANARVRKEQARLRLIFDLAAATIVEAIQQNKETLDLDVPDDISDGDLPHAILQYRRLQTLRVESMQRSHENREYARRKSATASAPNEVTSSSGGGGSGGGSKTALTKKERTSSEGPKFTRNTPASSAAALDFRFNSSRAILCAAGNIVFDALTPGAELDKLAVPQNPATDDGGSPSGVANNSGTSGINMGAVAVEAQIVGQRTIQIVSNAVRRATLRYQCRHLNALAEQDEDQDECFLKVPNAFDWRQRHITEEDDVHDEDATIAYKPNTLSQTEQWQSICLPRFLAIRAKGAGNVIYHDLDWDNRHGRLAGLLKGLCSEEDNFGPHLILTTEPEIVRFGQEFKDINAALGLVTTNRDRALLMMAYHGSTECRRKQRQYFPQATGLPQSSFHVLVASYSHFLEDFLHFSQLPFETVIVDDGMGWMAAAQGDQNSSLRSIWETAMFSTNDHHMGLAGIPTFREWDFCRDLFPESVVKEARVGLTARHRILTASSFVTQQRTNLEVVGVSCLVYFLAPNFSDTVREEWDRSRIASDVKSMKHFRKLVARSTVVHSLEELENDDWQSCELAIASLTGQLGSADRSNDPVVPRVVPDEEFVSSGKVASSRRWALAWLGAPEQSWLRYELGNAKFEPILDVMKLSNNHGHFCEEITTASSTTSSGVSGQVAGTMAYRLAVCCGRHFGSEQGLRQHVSALHAPPGTWLCRTCSMDCVTSQARTHHERSCGQPLSTVDGDPPLFAGGTTPNVGQGGGPKSGVGKKKGGRPSGAQVGGTSSDEKDADGSLRVPGYRGVWINAVGKHFIKIDGERYKNNLSVEILFDNVDDAAKKYDEIVRQQKKESGKKNQKVELNFKPDGTRIIYEVITPATTSGLGGSASNVVPALSVINIKDLPPDVKPLLRDPRQTSRTGGNSKRHVYAYRGVCRQARKGHDRWQSQISFMGQNHYLGTFDSEWDAAAIYAWAHLILYGEEATRQAQKEGEEAAAAYEREQREIAEGKVPEAPAKLDKKKKPTLKKADTKKLNDSISNDGEGRSVTEISVGDDGDDAKNRLSRKRKAKFEPAGRAEKKSRTNPEKKGKFLMTSVSARHKEAITPILTKGVSKAPILSRRENFEDIDDSELTASAAQKIKAARDARYSCAVSLSICPATAELRPCLPVETSGELIVGCAMLMGVSPSSCGWDLQGFVEANQLESENETMTALQLLAVEYDEDGVNEKFTCVMQGTLCVIGCADRKSQQAYQSLGLGSPPIGGTVGKIDCHIGGFPGSCSEISACIRYDPCSESDFKIICLALNDIVTVNGKRLSREDGYVALRNGDICSVGARVFSFVQARKD